MGCRDWRHIYLHPTGRLIKHKSGTCCSQLLCFVRFLEITHFFLPMIKISSLRYGNYDLFRLFPSFCVRSFLKSSLFAVGGSCFLLISPFWSFLQNYVTSHKLSAPFHFIYSSSQWFKVYFCVKEGRCNQSVSPEYNSDFCTSSPSLLIYVQESTVYSILVTLALVLGVCFGCPFVLSPWYPHSSFSWTMWIKKKH